MSDTLRPMANHCLISIPSRYLAPKGPRSPDGLAITLLSGDDAMHELEAQIKGGGALQFETETDRSMANLVRVGQVLQIPPQLTTDMVLCAAGEQVRTFADIAPVVEVGDTVFLDRACLIDENEILPGIYRVSYAAVICVIENQFNASGPLDDVCANLNPVGGYVLLSRVWASDVEDAEIDGRMRKVRYASSPFHYANGERLIDQIDVPALPNEGIVAWVDAPLKGAVSELRPGQRVVLSAGHALIETICGESYLCVRHDYILGIREFQQNTFTKEFQRLPLEHPSDNS